MNRTLCFFLLCFLFLSVKENLFLFADPLRQPNNRPIIGILTQELSFKLKEVYNDQYDSYISASYVKFIEGAGARVVPIWIGKNDSYYEDIMSKINGVLFPGGSSHFDNSEGYSGAGEKIYKIAKRLNDNGDYFPILGICLGFELITFLEANRENHRSKCSSNNQPLPLEFTADYNESKMFQNAPKNVIQILKRENVTANYHIFCVTKSDLKKVNIEDKFRVMSMSHDRQGLEFISTFEHRNYPFYGTQFHPEKNLYEWVKNKNIPHGKNSTIVSQFFAEFFVDEARRSQHKFEAKYEEMQSLIYNFPVTYTGSHNLSFIQCYLFKNSKRRMTI